MKRPSITAATALTLVGVALLLLLWGTVLLGRRSLIGGDILYQLPPWSGAPGAHPPRNGLVSDPVLQMLAWQTLVRDAFLHLRLPLWNSMALSGSPLLANDQSAAFSPFTWIALPFPPAYGLSLAMLAKLCVAATGMGLYLRSLKASSAAAVLSGLIYAGSSYMIVWLAWPQSSVAALIPFAFASVEWYLDVGRPFALAAIAISVGLQFLAGHAETSLHMGGALAIYTLLRVVALGRPGLSRLGGVVGGALAGGLLAGIQLVPFAAILGRSSLSADRAAAGFGLGHLPLSDLSSWLVPNARGNPAIDHLLGRAPNYNESTGFATISALVLAPLGLWSAWFRRRSAAVALAVIGLLAVGIAYGPLTPVAGRLPGLSVSGNERLIAVICLVLAALAGLGFDRLITVERPRAFSIAPWLFGAGVAGLLGVAVSAALLLHFRARVDQLLPAGPRGFIGFWLLLAGLSLLAAAFLVCAWWTGFDRRLIGSALAALVLGEIAIFAGPYNPRVPMAEVPPASAAMDFLRTHPAIAVATGLRMAPESSTLYGVVDARGYDVVIDRRERAFWSDGDPGYHDEALLTLLEQPDPRFLAAAGVAYVMTAPNATIPGTAPVFQGENVAIAAVPDARPFAFIAPGTIDVSSTDQARQTLAADPLGPVVVEGAASSQPARETNGGSVRIVSRTPERVELAVSTGAASTVVVLQSYDAGWVAHVDGRPATIKPADVLFQAISVPAGGHVLVLDYAPVSVAVGAALSGLGVLAILAAVAFELFRRRRLQ